MAKVLEGVWPSTLPDNKKGENAGEEGNFGVHPNSIQFSVDLAGSEGILGCRGNLQEGIYLVSCSELC